MKSKKKKKEKKEKYILKEIPPKSRHSFALMKGFFLFVLLWVFSLIFTQALHSPLSSVLFVFVTFLPLFELAQIFIMRSAVSVTPYCPVHRTEKGNTVDYSVKIENPTIFPVIMAEADIMLPNKELVRVQKQRTVISVLPFSACDNISSARFHYRGCYEIGVESIYFYDIFRLFRIRKTLERYDDITVLPRKKAAEFDKESFSSDFSTESESSLRGADKTELSFVREYRMGDRLKNIHWKLSGKSEELQSKEFEASTGKTVYILLDLAAHFSTEEDGIYSDDINEYAADGVMEIGVSYAILALEKGYNCKFMFYNAKTDSPAQYDVSSLGDFDSILYALACAPLCSPSHRVTGLMNLISETQGTMTAVITSRPDGGMGNDMTQITSLSENATSIFYFNPSNKIIDSEEKEREKTLFELNRKKLSETGINIRQINNE